MSERIRERLHDQDNITSRGERFRLSHQEGIFVDDFNHHAIATRREIWIMNCVVCGEKYESMPVPRCLINKLKCPKCIDKLQ